MAFLEFQTNLRAWWEAGDLGVSYDSGSEIAAPLPSWVSRVNPTYVLSGTAGTGPIYMDDGSGPNGQPYILFDGVNDFLQGGATWANLFTGSTGTLIVVAQPDAISSNSGTPRLNDALIHSSAEACPGMFLRNAAGVYTYYAQDYQSGYVSIAHTITPAAEALLWNIFVWRKQADGDLQAIRNNAYVANTQGGVIGDNYGNALRVGRNGGGGEYFAGKLAMILAYRAELTNAELGKAMAYPMAKYFSPNDSTHPSPIIRGDGTEQVRDAMSRRLIERQQRPQDIEWTGGLALIDRQIGDVVDLSHSQGPDPEGAGGGWPPEAPKRHRVIGVKRISATAVTLTLRPL